MRDRRAILFAVLSLSLAVCFGQIATAQETSRISIDQVIVQEQDGGEITALVSAVGDGRPILGLTGFEVFVDGRAVQLESVRPVIDAEAAVAVLVLIDVSESMVGEPLDQARRAATLFVEGLGSNDSAAIVPFGNEAPQEAQFTNDREVLLVEIDSLEAEGRTALYASFVSALKIANGAPLPRRALILLTDGKDSGENIIYTRGDALRAAATSSLPIFAIGLGGNADLDFLRALVQDREGGFYHAPAPADVLDIFDAIGATLRSQYSLILRLPPSERTTRELLVRLELPETTLSAQTTFSVPDALIVIGDDSAIGDDSVIGDDGGFPTLLAAGLGAIGILIAIALVGILRRRSRVTVVGGHGAESGWALRPARHVQQPTAVGGTLKVVEGPNAGASIELGDGAVEIGSSATCGLKLDEAGGTVGGTHARVWLHGDRLMLHHLARQGQTFVADKAVEWATLDPRDSLRIGPHVIVFATDNSL